MGLIKMRKSRRKNKTTKKAVLPTCDSSHYFSEIFICLQFSMQLQYSKYMNKNK